MRQFELFSLRVFLSLVFAGFAVFFPPMARAITVGFYAGSFDPPTRGELAMFAVLSAIQAVTKNAKTSGKQFPA